MSNQITDDVSNQELMERMENIEAEYPSPVDAPTHILTEYTLITAELNKRYDELKATEDGC